MNTTLLERLLGLGSSAHYLWGVLGGAESFFMLVPWIFVALWFNSSFRAPWLSGTRKEVENSALQDKNKKNSVLSGETFKDCVAIERETKRNIALWRDRKKHRNPKRGIAGIEHEFPGWKPGTYWTANSYDALDKLAGENIHLVCVEMPFGNCNPEKGYKLKRNLGKTTGYIYGENRLCDCNYESKTEILEFHKNWHEMTRLHKDNLESVKNYPDLKSILEHEIPEFSQIRNLTRDIHFYSKALNRFIYRKQFFRAKNNVINNSIVYDYCEGVACSALRMFFILNMVQKVRGDSSHVLLFCDKGISECVRLLADKVFPENSFVGDAEWRHRENFLNYPDDLAMASRNNRDEDIILHYYKNSVQKTHFRNFLLVSDRRRYPWTEDSYGDLFDKLVDRTTNSSSKVLILSNARSRICDAAEKRNLEWMGIKAFPSNFSYDKKYTDG